MFFWHILMTFFFLNQCFISYRAYLPATALMPSNKRRPMRVIWIGASKRNALLMLSLEWQRETVEGKVRQIYRVFFYWPVRNHSGLIEADNGGKYKTGRLTLLVGTVPSLPHYWGIVMAFWNRTNTLLHTLMFPSKTCRNKGMKIQKLQETHANQPPIQNK